MVPFQPTQTTHPAMNNRLLCSWTYLRSPYKMFLYASKTTTILSVPKNNKDCFFNEYCPVALGHSTPSQTAWTHSNLPNATTDQARMPLHTTLGHLDNKNCTARLLFVDHSSTFNTVIQSKLIQKLLGFWILDP